MHFARLQELYTTKKYPILAIKSGMLLELHEDVGEGDTKRIQKFKGLVIQVKKPNHPDGTFTIRGSVAGIVVEKIFPLSFEKFEKVILLDLFQTRRARINYIRDKIGKDAKMKSIITVDLKGKDLLAEAREKFAEEAAEEPKADTADTTSDTPTQETPVASDEAAKEQDTAATEKVDEAEQAAEVTADTNETNTESNDTAEDTKKDA